MTDYNSEHEVAILAGIKRRNSLYDELRLQPEDFYDRKHRDIYLAMGAIIERGDEVDDLTLHDELNKQQASTRHFVDADIPIGNTQYYVNSVRDLARKRKLRRLQHVLADGLESDTADEIIESIESVLTDVSIAAHRDMVHIRDLLRAATQEIERRYNDNGDLVGITSGFPSIDRQLMGFRPGHLVIIAARTSIGKTALALSMAINMAHKGIRVGYFSCEMDRQELALRLIAMEARLSLRAVQSGMMGAAGFTDIHEAGSRLYKTELVIDDTPNIALSELRSKVRQFCRQGGAVAFIDYLTLIRHGDQQVSRPERVGEISKSLKGLARELEMPIIVLSQLNRYAEGVHPSLAHIRQSGEIEEDADIVMLLHRERDSNEAILNLAKVRNGQTGLIDLTFLAEYVRFEERGRE